MKKLLITLLLVSLTSCQQTETVTPKTTCLQAQQAIENANYQLDIIEKQLMLTSNDNTIIVTKARKSDIETAVKMFDAILEDPELQCSKHLK